MWEPQAVVWADRSASSSPGGQGVTVVPVRSHLHLFQSVNPAEPTVTGKSKEDPTFWQLVLWFGNKKKHKEV